MEMTLNRYIETTPGVRGGKPCLVGRRIAVADVATDYLQLGYALEEIASTYELPLAAVYTAMAFYYDHRTEIDRQTQTDENFVATLRPQYPSRLQAKLQERRSE